MPILIVDVQGSRSSKLVFRGIEGRETVHPLIVSSAGGSERVVYVESAAGHWARLSEDQLVSIPHIEDDLTLPPRDGLDIEMGAVEFHCRLEEPDL